MPGTTHPQTPQNDKTRNPGQAEKDRDPKQANQPLGGRPDQDRQRDQQGQSSTGLPNQDRQRDKQGQSSSGRPDEQRERDNKAARPEDDRDPESPRRSTQRLDQPMTASDENETPGVPGAPGEDENIDMATGASESGKTPRHGGQPVPPQR